MVQLTGPLAKLLKKTKLVIVAVEDDSSKNTDVIKVELPEIMRVKGSNPLPNGKDMFHAEDFLYVAVEDINIFNEGVKEVEVNGKLTTIYEGPLKLDVSKPKGRMVNNQWTWTSKPKLWLVSVPFNRRGSDLIQETQETMRGALNTLFATPEETAEELAKQTAATKGTTAAGEAETPKADTPKDTAAPAAAGGAGGNKARGGANIGG